MPIETVNHDHAVDPLHTELEDRLDNYRIDRSYHVDAVVLARVVRGIVNRATAAELNRIAALTPAHSSEAMFDQLDRARLRVRAARLRVA